MGSRLVRILAVASGLALVACSTVETAQDFNANPTTGTDSGVDDVPLPSGDSLTTGADAEVPNDDAGDVACPPSSDGQGTLCITINKGDLGPLIDADARNAYIDGLGALTVAVYPDPLTRDEKAIATRVFPSATSGVAFAIENELPKVATLSVPPGTYWVLPAFQDREPFGRHDLEPGDYVPKIGSTGVTLTKLVVAANQAVTASIDIFPVREIDVDVGISTTIKPIGSGAGPLVAELSGAGGVTGGGTLACATISGDSSARVRVFTTDSASLFGFRVGLFDFAQSLDDTTISLDSPPPGAILQEGVSYLKIPTTAWIAPSTEAELRRVIPFTGAVPPDPTPMCTAATVVP